MKYFIPTLLVFGIFLLSIPQTQAQSDVLANQQESIVTLEESKYFKKYGNCYAKCIKIDPFMTVKEQVLIEPDSSRYPNFEPVYKIRTEDTLIREAIVELIAIPPVFETVIDSICVLEASPYTGVYETMTDRIQISPETGEWILRSQERGEKDYCIHPKMMFEECQIVCWEKIPTEYMTVTRKILKTITDTIEVKAEYVVFEKKILKTPAILKMIESPAEYGKIDKQVVIAYKNGEETLDPKYEMKTRIELRKETIKEIEWKQVMCDLKSTTDLIKKVQQALKDKGYYDGPIDGAQNVGTNKALQKFRRDINFPPCCQFCSGRLFKALGIERK